MGKVKNPQDPGSCILQEGYGCLGRAQEYLPMFERRSILSGGVARPFHTRSMRSPRALPDRYLSTQTGEGILARTLKSRCAWMESIPGKPVRHDGRNGLVLTIKNDGTSGLGIKLNNNR